MPDQAAQRPLTGYESIAPARSLRLSEVVPDLLQNFDLPFCVLRILPLIAGQLLRVQSEKLLIIFRQADEIDRDILVACFLDIIDFTAASRMTIHPPELLWVRISFLNPLPRDLDLALSQLLDEFRYLPCRDIGHVIWNQVFRLGEGMFQIAFDEQDLVPPKDQARC